LLFFLTKCCAPWRIPNHHKTPQARTQLERQIAHTDSEIDSLVYALYELSAEEVKVVEGE
jgi:hypothetical protein